MNLLHIMFGRARRARLDLPPMTPRDAAIELLREHLDNGRAGLDPYDETILIVDAHENEHVWAHRCLELIGIVVRKTLNHDGCQTTRYRAIVEADVRSELGLDVVGAPTMDDVPLVSRGVDASPVLRAIDTAKDAYDRLFPNGVTAVH